MRLLLKNGTATLHKGFRQAVGKTAMSAGEHRAHFTGGRKFIPKSKFEKHAVEKNPVSHKDGPLRVWTGCDSYPSPDQL